MFFQCRGLQLNAILVLIYRVVPIVTGHVLLLYDQLHSVVHIPGQAVLDNPELSSDIGAIFELGYYLQYL